jgi:hypothetical protein
VTDSIPGSDTFAVLHPARDAAWRILDRLRQLTEPTDRPDEEPLSLPRLLQVVGGRTIPLADDPIPARPLAARGRYAITTPPFGLRTWPA